jgi:hypothetical protein
MVTMRVSCIAGVALLAALGVSTTAQSQCTYTSLASGTAVATSAAPQYFSFNQTASFYSAVGVRPAPGEDWNVEVYQSTADAPSCVATLLGSSSRTTGVDFVIGDFNLTHNALGVRYPVVTQASGSAGGVVEWDNGANSITVNGPTLSRSTGATDVIEVWDVGMTTGLTYTITFRPVGADLKLLLFKSGAGTFWAGRDDALLEVAAGTTFTPAATGIYSIVVLNDDGAAGSYTLGVGICDAPTSLTSGTTVTTTRAEKYYVFDQDQTFWTAVGARGASAWEVAVYDAATGGMYPTCFGDSVAGSMEDAPTVDFIAGNFEMLTVGARYARVYLKDHIGTGTATVEWDGGPDLIEVNEMPLNRSTGSTDLLEVWDVYLENNSTYQFQFDAIGANLRLFLFEPAGIWVARAGAVLELSGSPSAQAYSATSTGWHGLVVVNENGASGSYSLAVSSSLVSVEDERPSYPTALGGIAPNPARGSMQISFSLQERGEVSFDILDVAGRRVAEMPAKSWAPGKWSVGWSGGLVRGGALGAGVYFLRMRVGERTVGHRKVTLLD